MKIGKGKHRELKIIFAVAAIYFVIFLVLPVCALMGKSLMASGGISFDNYISIFMDKNVLKALGNSFGVSGAAAAVTTLLAFVLSYAVNYTNIPGWLKGAISSLARLPMLLPTITYGFAIIYSFGKQGLITRLLGHQLFDIYGFAGLMVGYVIYTLPVSFMLIQNTMRYIDKRFIVVSRLMNDHPIKGFAMTIVRPLLGTLAASFIQCFFLCFTDFGIPAAVGGSFDTIAGVLYTEMLGSVPDFGRGAVIAFVMLLPSIVSVVVLHILEKYNIRYTSVSDTPLKKSRVRDMVLGIISSGIILCVLSVFAVIFVIPFIKDWPYNLTVTFEHVATVFSDNALLLVMKNSLLIALLTAFLGTLVAYGCALITARSSMAKGVKSCIEGIAMVTNTIPGMVLGLSYLFIFSGSFLQGTLVLLILCNIIHYFSTPYIMMKSSLSKLNASWETTAMLMGDSWMKTIVRVVTPNALPTILEVFGYYFINAMVTISAVIFIAGARTMVITTKIKELQYYNKYSEIFVLSLLILFINLLSKALLAFAQKKMRTHVKEKKKMKKAMLKKAAAAGLCLALGCGILGGGVLAAGMLTGCGGSGGSDKVIIYSNADDEAVTAMKNALDNNGYKDQYMFQTFGTSELGGKLLAEGTNLEADLVTMSTFYVESAQDQNQMFLDLGFEAKTLDEYPSYCAPITAQEGTIIINTQMMEENNLPYPGSIKDLADPQYAGFVSVTDIASSSTAWLLIQGLISAYGEDEAQSILAQIYENAGPHIEESGSGPLKKVRAGEVAIGFGLRQQAVADKAEGLPIDYIDPSEGNFTLTESVAVVNKGDKTNAKAMEMAQCIIENGREELQSHYPVALYEGEVTDTENASGNPKVFPEKLTVDLLKAHQEISERAKEAVE